MNKKTSRRVVRPVPEKSFLLVGLNQNPLPLRNLEALEDIYRYWTYVVANRLRIDDESRTSLQKRAQADFAKIGVSIDDLKRLATSKVIEVSMPFRRETEDWAARVCPWESLLSLATKPLRKPDQHTTIVRQLRRRDAGTASIRKSESLLIIVSAPGKLKRFFNFNSERDLVMNAFQSKFAEANIHYTEDPTLEELTELIDELRPDVIHLAGIDSHQAAALLRSTDEIRHDGVMLLSADKQAVAVESEPLAEALTVRGQHRPSLVAFNCYNSAARLAAMAVAHGAEMAIGFQDTIDDALAEQYFSNLYNAWNALQFSSLIEPFTLAREQLTIANPARNTGDVVLWSASSLVAQGSTSLEQYRQAADRALKNSEPWLNAISSEFDRLRAAQQKLAPSAKAARRGAPRAAQPAPVPPTPAAAPTVEPPSPADRRLAQVLTFEVTPLEQLNYSLLHNRRAIFKRFRINVRDQSVLPITVEVKVHLFAGEDSFSIRSTHVITIVPTDLHEKIRLPLIAPMLRGRREGIASALTSEIYHGAELLHSDTSPLRLLPADEWTDTDEDRRWLPSFILPRDPAVQRIFESAQRYLRALTDDSSSSFDGYQRVLDGSDDSLAIVDAQVRALWYTLLYDHPIAYINPPPTYTKDAQRIRSPSQMMEERRGTCLDLALLFAASLEYLGIMPVMFLIHGHAFPGYWRSPTAQSTFREFDNVNLQAISSGSSYGEKIREGWMVQGDGGLAEITRAIQEGGLMPLETTVLTRQGSFQAAQELGVRSLMTRWGFDAMVEIQRARDNGVTPLPLLHLDL